MSTTVFSNQSSIFFTIFSVSREPKPYQKLSDVLHGKNQDHSSGQTPQQDPEVHPSRSRGIGGIRRSSWLPYRVDQKQCLQELPGSISQCAHTSVESGPLRQHRNNISHHREPADDRTCSDGTAVEACPCKQQHCQGEEKGP